MFTGLIEDVGKIISISSDRITINCSAVLQDTKLGDSIAVNGVCLTVTDIGHNYFSADISPETLKVTALSELRQGSFVNLERALLLSSRLGGHIVSGHIDSVGEITKINKFNDFYELTISVDKSYDKYIVKKGSVAINGISLTVANCYNSNSNICLSVAIIPHTYDKTALKNLKTGDKINVEFDILAKYVEKNLSSLDNNNITVDFLAQNGFC